MTSEPTDTEPTDTEPPDSEPEPTTVATESGESDRQPAADDPDETSETDDSSDRGARFGQDEADAGDATGGDNPSSNGDTSVRQPQAPSSNDDAADQTADSAETIEQTNGAEPVYQTTSRPVDESPSPRLVAALFGTVGAGGALFLAARRERSAPASSVHAQAREQ